jgi:hypothetical protein
MAVKNWPNDPHLNCTSIAILENYMKGEYPLVEENYDLIEKVSYFK